MEGVKIGIVGGLGHIGLIQGAGLAELGYQTVSYDKDAKKVREILEGKMPFFEEGLEETIKKAIENSKLSFTADIKDLQGSEILFICVNTPSLPAGKADTSQVYAAVEEAARSINNPFLAVIKSTVPVGTNRGLTAYLEKKGLAQKVTMVSNPEFLREGSGLHDFRKPSRIVIGAASYQPAEKVARLYSPLEAPVIITTWENAELIKYASNAFLAAKISFINEVALLCEKVGGDILEVSRGIGLDPRINPHFLEAGAGFSGPCLEKDLKSLIHQFKKAGEEAKLLKAVLEVNEKQRRSLVQKLEKELGTLKGKHIGILGIAFKAGTDDVRNSHSLPIIKELLSRKAKLTLHDPRVNNFQQAGLSEEDFPGVEWVLSPYEAAEGKEALLILTAWPQYRELDLSRLKDKMAHPLIVDGRNIFEPQKISSLGIKYLGVGR